MIPERIIFVSRGITVHCCIKFWYFTLFHDEYARSNNPQIILGVSAWKKVSEAQYKNDGQADVVWGDYFVSQLVLLIHPERIA